ncbi:MAG: hypothetical protein ACLRSE_09740 [Alistipes finegoldii]
MDRPSAEPRRRSPFRLWCGRLWYTCLRYGLWYFGGLRFARNPALRAATIRTSGTGRPCCAG